MSDEMKNSHNELHADTQHLLSKLKSVAADVASTRTIDHEDRVEACTTAHQLAHALELAGLTDATAKARDVVATLDHQGLPQPERLQQQVQALATLLER